MRYCVRCNTEMVENYKLNVQGKLYGVNVTHGDANKSLKKAEEIKVAICPKCGEISLYVETK